MPLSASGLKAALKTELTSVNYNTRTDAPPGSEPLAADLDKSLDALAKAIVDYFTANALVTGTCPPGNAGGPLTNGRVT